MHSNYTLYAVTPAALRGVLGLSVTINIILAIVVAILITKVRITSPLLPTIAAMVNEGEGKHGTLDIADEAQLTVWSADCCCWH